ncbi:Nif11-like leader peptide family natural product precursor [Nostoc sp.]|uniref:Nif11-like leader peptide family natural product precursor n=1 Tax=Nostoc sp. TaxID=1180 RepID=UPI002FFA5F7B
MSLENVQAFYAKLANDEAFRTQIKGVTSNDECSQFVQGAGYDFTQEEFEEYTTQLLESTADEGELRDLNEKELEAVFGGFVGKFFFPWCPPIHKPPIVQPLYGVILSPSTS